MDFGSPGTDWQQALNQISVSGPSMQSPVGTAPLQAQGPSPALEPQAQADAPMIPTPSAFVDPQRIGGHSGLFGLSSEDIVLIVIGFMLFYIVLHPPGK